MICYYPNPLSLFQAQNTSSVLTFQSSSGSIIELRKTGSTVYQVENLISTDPQEYLTGIFRPGQIVDAKIMMQFL